MRFLKHFSHQFRYQTTSWYSILANFVKWFPVLRWTIELPVKRTRVSSKKNDQFHTPTSSNHTLFLNTTKNHFWFTMKLFIFKFLLFTIFFINFTESSPQPEAEPENDDDRQAFKQCLMKNCKRCYISRWRLLMSRRCDECSKEECGSGDFERKDWFKYNKFIERSFHSG